MHSLLVSFKKSKIWFFSEVTLGWTSWYTNMVYIAPDGQVLSLINQRSPEYKWRIYTALLISNGQFRLFLSPSLRPFSGASGQTMGDTYPHWLFMVNCDILPAFLQKVLLLRCKKVEKSPIQNYWCFACAWFKSDPFQPYWPVQHWQGWGVDISAVQEHWGPRTATQRGPKKVGIISLQS